MVAGGLLLLIEFALAATFVVVVIKPIAVAEASVVVILAAVVGLGVGVIHEYIAHYAKYSIHNHYTDF